MQVTISLLIMVPMQVSGQESEWPGAARSTQSLVSIRKLKNRSHPIMNILAALSLKNQFLFQQIPRNRIAKSRFPIFYALQ